MAKINLNTAEQTRVKLTQQQEKHIAQIYKRAAQSVGRKARNLPDTPSSPLYKTQLNALKKELNEQLKAAEQALKGEIRENMKSAAQAVADDNQKFLEKVGLNIEGAYYKVPTQIVRSVATGQLYRGKWSLDKALWKDHMKTQYDINTVVAEGIAANRSAYDIAKDLEKYLNPSAKKEWDWNKVYPGTRRKVDYSAQRLARTMVSHAYQQAFVQTTRNNPFVEEYVWLASGGERMCEICAERNGQHFPKNLLPLDHPNGMCTFEAALSDNLIGISNRLGDWATGNADPEIDAWMESLGVDPNKLSNVQRDTQMNNTGGNTPPADQWISMIEQVELDEMLALEEEAFKKFEGVEKDALRAYTGNAFRRWNWYLRTGDTKDLYSDDLSRIQQAQQALSKSAFTKGMVLRRGTDLGDLAGLIGGDFNANMNMLEQLSVAELNKRYSGLVGEYKGFTSTSSLWDRGFSDDVEIVFYAPKGTQGSSIMGISKFGTDEGETLLNAGTRVKVLRIEESDRHMSSHIRMFMEIIP